MREGIKHMQDKSRGGETNLALGGKNMSENVDPNSTQKSLHLLLGSQNRAVLGLLQNFQA